MSLEWAFAIVAGVYALAELASLLTARARWAQVGVGLIDEESGALTLTAVPIDFPPLLDIANETDSHLVMTLISLVPGAPADAGRILTTRMRAHEALIRVDFDRYAALLLSDDRAGTVEAAVRLTDGLDDQTQIGFASAPADGADFYALLDRSTNRRAPLTRVRNIAATI